MRSLIKTIIICLSLYSINSFSATIYITPPDSYGGITKYDAATGQNLGIFGNDAYNIHRDSSIALGEGNIFVTRDGGVTKYNTSTGEYLGIFGNDNYYIKRESSIAYGDGIVFVTGDGANGIRKYDAETGVFLGLFQDGYNIRRDSNILYQPSPVPLPAGIYLFLSGLVGLGLMRGRNG